MKFEDIHTLMQKPDVKPDTYEAGMALNQLLKIGTHAIKIHNMIKDDQEMEAWVAKKIDLASNYVKSVHGYTAGEKAGTYDDDGMSEARLQSNWTVSFQMPKGNHRRNSFTSQDDAKKFADAVKSKGGTVDSVKLITGKNADDLSTSVRSLEMKRMPKGTGTMQGVKEDAGDQEKMQGLLQWFKNKYDTYRKDFIDDQIENGIRGSQLEQAVENNDELVELENIIDALKSGSMKDAIEEINRAKYEFSGIPGDGDDFMQVIEKLGIPKDTFYFTKDESVSEDAGEGHMSKSQLYQTAKMAIELLDMIKKGDDLEGWVQTKLNLAADYLQAVYHYEDYQKLNPYREEIDSKILHRHAGIIQKHLDEILERKCRAEDVDTKPGMMRILKKRVNEVEKELAKKMREDVSKKDVDTFHKKLDKLVHKSFGHSPDEKEMKKEDIVNEDPRAVGRALANLKYAKAMADGIMKGDDMVLLRPKAQAFLSSADETINLLDKMYAGPTNEDAYLEEGIKEWAKKLAMAGVIVAGLAGIGSVNDAINNSVPAIKAMNTALEMAEKSGNDDLAKMIEKDLRDAKVRLDSGRDLPYVKDLQDKYAKFMTTEGLNFESRLAVRLEQRIK